MSDLRQTTSTIAPVGRASSGGPMGCSGCLPGTSEPFANVSRAPVLSKRVLAMNNPSPILHILVG